VKELRFSIQCGASNRKALVARRCSQCTIENDNIELDEIPQQNQLLHRTFSNRSSSSLPGHLQAPKHRTKFEQTSDSDKFDTLLMLAAERTNYLDTRRKNYYNETRSHKHRNLSSSPERKDIPLVLIEQQSPSNHESKLRSHQVRFSTNNAGMIINSSVLNVKKESTKKFCFFFSRFINSKH
jgi:hypothetical protein